MPTVTFICIDGSRRTIPAKAAETVMEVAVRHGIEGIVAECGGGCVCGTCHVYVQSGAVPEAASELETDVLDGAAAERRGNSRLSCQLRLDEETELTVVIPDRQR